MKQQTILLLSLLVSVCSAMSGAREVDQSWGDRPWEDRPTGSRNKVADKWWCDTWRLGDHIETCASYQFTGTLKMDGKNGKVRWWEKWKDYIERDLNVEIKGVSKMSTKVLMGNGWNGGSLPQGAEIQLLRDYETPMSFRGAAVVGLKDGQRYERAIREAQNKFVDMLNDEEYQGILKTAKAASIAVATAAIMSGAAALATVPGCQWAAVAANPKVATAAATLLIHEGSKFASRKLEEQRIANLKKLASGELSDGGIEAKIEAKEKSWFFKKFRSQDADKLRNFATSLNELFNNKTFFICGKPNSQIFVKKIEDDSPAKRILFDTKIDPFERPLLFRELPITENDNKARNILSRETLDVNAKLFGLKERSKGETWITDATILNGFLHEDLTGKFSGYIVMTYKADEKISLQKFGSDIGSKSYNVRHLQMVESHRGTYTKFSYEEPEGFKVRFNAKDEGGNNGETMLNIYVDIKTGYILKVDADFSRNDIETLPKLKLSDGFLCAKGNVTFKIDAESCPMPNIALQSDVALQGAK